MKLDKWSLVILLCCLICGCATSPQDARLYRLVDRLVIPEADFRETNMHDVADFFAEWFRPKERVNVVFRPGNTEVPIISLAFSDLTLRQALNVTCDVAGMKWEIRDGVIMIEPE
jgi:hypothetical protein